jgi:hypothetical protein
MIKKFSQFINEGIFGNKPKRRVSYEDAVQNYSKRDKEIEKKYPVTVIYSYGDEETTMLDLRVIRNNYRLGGELYTNKTLKLSVQSREKYIVVEYSTEHNEVEGEVLYLSKSEGIMLEKESIYNLIQSLREALDSLGAGNMIYRAINTGKIESILGSFERYDNYIN